MRDSADALSVRLLRDAAGPDGLGSRAAQELLPVSVLPELLDAGQADAGPEPSGVSAELPWGAVPLELSEPPDAAEPECLRTVRFLPERQMPDAELGAFLVSVQVFGPLAV